MLKEIPIIGAICVGALRGSRINEVVVIRDGYYDEENHIWWINGCALVFDGGDARAAREHSISYSTHGDWIGGAIYPLFARGERKD